MGPQLLCHMSSPCPSAGGLLLGEKVPKAKVSSCSAFVLSQEGEEEASYLGNSPPLLIT